MRVVDIPSVIKILIAQGGTSQNFIREQRKAVTRVNITATTGCVSFASISQQYTLKQGDYRT